MFQTLELIAFTTAETALNAYLQRHPETLAQLASLEGKVIALHTQSPALDLYLLPNAQGIMLERGLAQPANVSVHGTCTALMGLLKKEASTGHLPPGVSLEGETHVLTKFKSILLDDALDMETFLGNTFGDLAAGPLTQVFDTQKAQIKKTTESFSANLGEYLTEEAQILPTRVEIEIFCNQVDDTKERLERLEAKLSLLSQP